MQRNSASSSYMINQILILIALVIFLFLLYRIRVILPLFAAGMLLAYILDPIADELESRGWSRSAASLISFVFFLLLFVAAVIAIVPLVISQVQSFIEECIPPHGRYYRFAVELLKRIEESNPSQNPFLAYALQALSSFSKQLGEFILGRIRWAVTSLGSLLSILLLPIITYYSLQIIDPLRQRVLALIPVRYRAEVVTLLHETGKLIGRYFRGYMLLCVCVGIIDGVILWLMSFIFHNDYAAAIGFTAGITYSIPYIGAVGSAILAFIVGYLTSEHYQLLAALFSAGVITVVNQIFDWLIMPKVIGQRVGLHPLIAIFAVMAGSVMFGIVGMIIAVPLAGCIKLALMQFAPKLFEPIGSGGAERG
ncbi:MAG: AI-2E family transporter [Armatimonadota bacterium]|nr:AI-2E family transporter [Armatimonadota bacterium]MCX7776682.1 AI-2E family transporter [Armatimonadota bacterium]MDW8025703.1 AI-2E family transporter [Armatimonadota bacterium]